MSAVNLFAGGARMAFDDGESADDTAPTYWETDWQRKLGPEECADADMSYWGE